MILAIMNKLFLLVSRKSTNVLGEAQSDRDIGARNCSFY